MKIDHVYYPNGVYHLHTPYVYLSYGGSGLFKNTCFGIDFYDAAGSIIYWYWHNKNWYWYNKK